MTCTAKSLASILSALLLGILLSPSARGEAGPTKIVLYAQGESRLALKHHLLPDFTERIEGNAVVYLGMVEAEQSPSFSSRERRDNIDRWQKAPLGDLREQQNFLTSDESGPLYYLDQAARCTRADWQLPIGREPYFDMLLPAVQEVRQFARILAAHGRIELAHGNFDAAIADYRRGLSLGRHLAHNQTLVAGLVGIRVCEVSAAEQIETFVQQPGAPNLYWELSQLPAPLVDLRIAVDAEVHAIELSFPEARNLDSVRLTPAQWRGRLMRLLEKVHAVADQKDWKPDAAYVDEAIPRLLPAAKKYLIDQGTPPEEIENMADAQIVLLDVLKRSMETRMEAAKWFPLPYPVASEGLRAVHEQTEQQWKDRRDIAPLAQLTPGPLVACRRGQVRLDRRIATLRVLEALRIHAAANDGKLPEKLADVTVAPMPNDPVAEKPFQYRLDGETATLTGPALPDAPLHYEISMAETP